MYTLGIDVHKSESHVVVLDDDDEIHQEVRVVMSKITFASSYCNCYGKRRIAEREG